MTVRPLRLVVRVQRQRLRGDAVVPQQRRGRARVLGRDDVGRRQHVERAQRQVAQVPQRCGHHI